MSSGLIRNQHLAMKLVIFIIGIATGLEASFLQLAVQSSIFLIFMLLEPQLYGKLLFALRRLLFFLTAYWIFATLFAMDFPVALIFSARIIYLLLVMVAVWGATEKRMLLQQCRCFTKLNAGRKILSYLLSTLYFMREYFNAYKAIPANENLHGILQRAIDAGANVHAQSEVIARKVEADLNFDENLYLPSGRANLIAVVFLFVLVMVNSL